MDWAGPTIRRVLFGTSVREHYVWQGRIQNRPEIRSMLARPSWSVRSMLPSEGSERSTSISREKLHHLLKLSALPLPKNQKEEQEMLKTLESQIHFVNEIQKVDTTGIEPLVAIRDETPDHIEESTVTLEKLRPYLDKEDKVGINGTIRRQVPVEMIKDSGWDPFELGAGKESRKIGRYFFVKKAKSKGNT